jgi:predicted RNase H-like HicB family nuclease
MHGRASAAKRKNTRKKGLHFQTMMTFTAVFQEAEEGGYVAFVAELPGANTQGETIEEARENLREAVELVLDANRRLALKDLDTSRIIREPMVVSAE